MLLREATWLVTIQMLCAQYDLQQLELSTSGCGWEMKVRHKTDAKPVMPKRGSGALATMTLPVAQHAAHQLSLGVLSSLEPGETLLQLIRSSIIGSQHSIAT